MCYIKVHFEDHTELMQVVEFISPIFFVFCTIYQLFLFCKISELYVCILHAYFTEM